MVDTKKNAELFEKSSTTITEHLQKIFSDGELDKNSVCRNFRLTTLHDAIKEKKHTQEVKY